MLWQEFAKCEGFYDVGDLLIRVPTYLYPPRESYGYYPVFGSEDPDLLTYLPTFRS